MDDRQNRQYEDNQSLVICISEKKFFAYNRRLQSSPRWRLKLIVNEDIFGFVVLYHLYV
jgi:hypothetical protein